MCFATCLHTVFDRATVLHTNLPSLKTKYVCTIMASNCVRHITLEFNCGYARTAVRELTPRTHGSQSIDKNKRSLEFQQLFADCPSYGLPESYFEDNTANGSLFNRDCDKLLKIWSKRWNPTSNRQEYEQHFCIKKWKANPHRQQHTLAKCKACQAMHYSVQCTFPQGPHFVESLLSIDTEKLQDCGKREGTVRALSEVNIAFAQVFETSFTESLIKYGKENIQKKPSALEKKKKRREIYRQCRDKENEALKRSSAIAVLTEDESIRGYQRKRKRQYFDTTPPAKQAKTKSHSPDFNTVTWDKDKVLLDLQQYPPAPPPINWLQFAKEHGVTGKNAGQVVKEFALKSGIDTEKLDGRQLDRPRTRVRRRKLVGGEISSAATPTPASLQEEWQKMVQSGELSLGRPCVPYTMTKYSAMNGGLERVELTIVGRKFPLLEIRKKLLAKHEKYMRLNTDTEIDSMSHSDLQSLSSLYHHSVSPESDIHDLRSTTKLFQRSRSLVLWHDHGTVLHLGCILLTVHVAYDPAVFLTQHEYETKHTHTTSIQSLVETPSIYMLAAGSSSTEDQVALLQDRLDCLFDLSTEISSSNGVIVCDKLHFFVGDHPAQQFERGTQQGGTYKCGGCEVKDVMMGDLAHSLQKPRRSLKDLQDLAIKESLESNQAFQNHSANFV